MEGWFPTAQCFMHSIIWCWKLRGAEHISPENLNLWKPSRKWSKKRKMHISQSKSSRYFGEKCISKTIFRLHRYLSIAHWRCTQRAGYKPTIPNYQFIISFIENVPCLYGLSGTILRAMNVNLMFWLISTKCVPQFIQHAAVQIGSGDMR